MCLLNNPDLVETILEDSLLVKYIRVYKEIDSISDPLVTPYRHTVINAGWFHAKDPKQGKQSIRTHIAEGIHVWMTLPINEKRIKITTTRCCVIISCYALREDLLGAEHCGDILHAAFTKIFIPPKEIKRIATTSQRTHALENADMTIPDHIGFLPMEVQNGN